MATWNQKKLQKQTIELIRFYSETKLSLAYSLSGSKALKWALYPCSFAAFKLGSRKRRLSITSLEWSSIVLYKSSSLQCPCLPANLFTVRKTLWNSILLLPVKIKLYWKSSCSLLLVPCLENRRQRQQNTSTANLSRRLQKQQNNQNGNKKRTSNIPQKKIRSKYNKLREPNTWTGRDNEDSF